MRFARRTATVLALAASLVAALPSVVGALMVWTLVGLPLTVTAGQLTIFTMTATSLDPASKLGCLEVDLPSTFQSITAGAATPSTGRNDWIASVSGTAVVVHTTTGGGLLGSGDSVTFTFKAQPTVAGAVSWPNHAHRRKDCSGVEETGTPIAVTVLPPILPTPSPTPVPTPRATPIPTPEPTPQATSTPPTPDPSRSASEPADGVPSASTRSPSSTPAAGSGTAASSARPSGVPSAATSGGPVASPSAGVGVPAPAASPGGPTVAFDGRRLNLNATSFGPLGGIEIWAVPAATLGLPGLLLVLAAIGLQAIGGLAWIPAVRRLRGDEEQRPA